MSSNQAVMFITPADLLLTTASPHPGVMGTWHEATSVMALVRVLKPLRLTPCSGLNTPQGVEKGSI